MSLPLEQHRTEIERNRHAWESKPLLREIYASFYRRVLGLIDPGIPGRILEIGSGIGNLKAHLPGALGSDLFPNPWLDLVCDGYELPFADGCLSHLLLFDVFHHLEAPRAFLREARRVLAPGGRLIVFEPFIGVCSYPVYGLLHHEPVAWRRDLNDAEELPRPRQYYAAQGNATRLFFHAGRAGWLAGWTVFHREAFSCWSYLLSGGFSRPAFYPAAWFKCLDWLDRRLSSWPGCFAGRCLVGLESSRL